MTQIQTRLRIRFTKKDELRWISHRDLARVWERLLRRAEICLAFSQGFHPKPKISFPSALALGIEALDEVVELEVLGAVDITDLRSRISQQVPPGMELLSLEVPRSKARILGSTYCVDLPDILLQTTRERIAELLRSDSITVQRDGKPVNCSVRQPFFDIRIDANQLYFTLPNAVEGTSLRPSELLQVLELGTLLESGSVLRRIRIHLNDESTSQDSSQVQDTYHESERDPLRLVSFDNNEELSNQGSLQEISKEYNDA